MLLCMWYYKIKGKLSEVHNRGQSQVPNHVLQNKKTHLHLQDQSTHPTF